jgi:hypothetical protein
MGPVRVPVSQLTVSCRGDPGHALSGKLGTPGDLRVPHGLRNQAAPRVVGVHAAARRVLEDAFTPERVLIPLDGKDHIQYGDTVRPAPQLEPAPRTGDRRQDSGPHQCLQLLVQVGGGQFVEFGQPGTTHGLAHRGPGHADTAVQPPLHPLPHLHIRDSTCPENLLSRNWAAVSGGSAAYEEGHWGNSSLGNDDSVVP